MKANHLNPRLAPQTLFGPPTRMINQLMMHLRTVRAVSADDQGFSSTVQHERV